MSKFSEAVSGLRILKDRGPKKLTERAFEYYFQKSKTHYNILRQREDLIAAEVGVWKGENAKTLLQKLDIKKLYLIDPYETYNNYDEKKATADKLASARDSAHERLDSYSNIEWVEKFSDEATEEIENELDYVYLDANHNYQYVKSDIKNYYDILNEDGIIAGDDSNWMGVARAVVEFAYEEDLQPHFERDHPDWFFIKNRPKEVQEPLPYTEEYYQKRS